MTVARKIRFCLTLGAFEAGGWRAGVGTGGSVFAEELITGIVHKNSMIPSKSNFKRIVDIKNVRAT
jgi:hypothetical protein